ncbi:predicted protein [Nematostella vectensis]|uniref:Serpin domain-containing protein n=1 Tax=Nematostella vectensis TaxID=45351 RepID=A7SKW7_NEMVE|nr:predicted protein [Nematostella vectensis]|eukprot:XP_001627750.1 predicted protein [Nematostella vectensis]
MIISVCYQGKGDAAKNTFYSPASICVALGMVYAGARGETADEMATAMHWEGHKPMLPSKHQEHKELSVALNNPGATNEMSIANNLFLQKDFSILKEFTDICQKYYDADISLVDYKTDFEGARKHVNQWVEERTKKKICDLIAPGVFNMLTRLTLVNAIYFKGMWDKPFKKEHSHSSEFRTTSSNEVEVEMMFQKSKFKYLHSDKYKCKLLELPYVDTQLSMVLVLPDETEGLARFEQDLTHDKMTDIFNSVSSQRPADVEVYIPKFKMTSEFKLNEALQELGMKKMFDQAAADFTGISLPPEHLFVSAVLHKAFVEVNEEGTEAAAATAAIMMMRCAIMREPLVFRADHPFLFLIQHCKSKCVLFMGRVMNPVE